MTHPLDLSAYDTRQPDLFRPVVTVKRPALSVESEHIAWAKRQRMKPAEVMASINARWNGPLAPTWGDVFFALCAVSESRPAARSRSVVSGKPPLVRAPKRAPVGLPETGRALSSQSRGAASFRGA